MTIAVPSLRAAIISGGTPSWVPRLDGMAADLVIDFANQRGWQSRRPVTDASLVAVTRATTTSYGRNAAGVYVPYSANTIRYDDVLGGALIEEARTNLCLQSSSLDSVTWSKPADVTITANSTTGIFGTATADTVTCNGTGAGGLFQTITVSASTTYTWSFFAKLGTLAASDYKFAVYDVTNAAFIGLNVVPSTLPTTTEWTLVSYTFTTPATCVMIRVYPLRNSSAISGTVYVDHCQLEAGAFRTSPIPTTTLAGSRAGDFAAVSLPVPLKNLPSYTILASVTFAAPTAFASNQYVTNIDDGTNSNRLTLRRNSGSGTVSLANCVTAETVAIGSTVANLGVLTRIGGIFSANDFTLIQNGAVAAASGSGSLPTTLNRFVIGANGSAGAFANGTISAVSVFGSRRTTASVQGVTS